MNLNELIQKCTRQDLSAQEQLYRLFADKLFAVSLKYSRNYEEAQDNLQDAFLTIFDKISQYQHKGSFEGWLKRITINTALQRYRKHKNVYTLVREENIEAPSVDEEEQDDDLPLSFLLSCIQELPDRYRMVFNLYVLDGFSHKEIASMMSIAEGTSKSNLARARQLLKQKISEKKSSTKSIVLRNEA